MLIQAIKNFHFWKIYYSKKEVFNFLTPKNAYVIHQISFCRNFMSQKEILLSKKGKIEILVPRKCIYKPSKISFFGNFNIPKRKFYHPKKEISFFGNPILQKCYITCLSKPSIYLFRKI